LLSLSLRHKVLAWSESLLVGALVVLVLVVGPLVRELGLELRLRLLIYSLVVDGLARLLVVAAILILTIVVGLGHFIRLGCLQVPT
jgi:hypothetical protein